MRELLRHALAHAVSSPAPAIERRLRTLEKRISISEQRQTEDVASLNSQMTDLKSRVDEWSGIHGYSQLHE